MHMCMNKHVGSKKAKVVELKDNMGCTLMLIRVMPIRNVLVEM